MPKPMVPDSDSDHAVLGEGGSVAQPHTHSIWFNKEIQVMLGSEFKGSLC